MSERKKYVFDIEYSTEWIREKNYLSDVGIPYVFAKKDSDGKIKWKYKKTATLFQSLADFYVEYENEQSVVNEDGERTT